jgi:hypothetical protein
MGMKSDSTAKFAFVLLNLVLVFIGIYIGFFELNTKSSSEEKENGGLLKMITMISSFALALIAFIGFGGFLRDYTKHMSFSSNDFDLGDIQDSLQKTASSPRIFLQTMQQSRPTCALMLLIVIIFIIFAVLTQKWLTKYEEVSKQNSSSEKSCLTFSTGSQVTFSTLSIYILYAFLAGLFLLTAVVFIKQKKDNSFDVYSS